MFPWGAILGPTRFWDSLGTLLRPFFWTQGGKGVLVVSFCCFCFPLLLCFAATFQRSRDSSYLSQMLVVHVDTCMVNQMMYDATLRAKVQQTVPCSQAASQQRGGSAGRDSPGVCVRLVTQLEWNNMPPRDPRQPHMDDQTSLYLRLASTEAISSIRERLLDTIGMTKELRAEAQQICCFYMTS